MISLQDYGPTGGAAECSNISIGRRSSIAHGSLRGLRSDSIK